MRIKLYTLNIFFLFIFVTSTNLTGQAAVSTTSLFESIQDEGQTHFHIISDLEFLKNSAGNEETDGTLSINGGAPLEISIESRGKYRLRICDFPPLRINLKKKELRGLGYLDFDKMKLVTHCNSDKKSPQEIFKEYLTYKLYNQITEESFKVKLIRITYEDLNNPEEKFDSWSIVIEPNDELAARLGGPMVDKFNMASDSMYAHNYNQMALFQFMIGNHDWSVQLFRNIKYVQIESEAKYKVIPYDFDLSCFVFPRYFMLDPNLPLKTARDRCFLGEYFNEQLEPVIEEFLVLEDALVNTVKNYKMINGAERARMRKVLNDFFRLIKKQGNLLSYKYLDSY